MNTINHIKFVFLAVINIVGKLVILKKMKIYLKSMFDIVLITSNLYQGRYISQKSSNLTLLHILGMFDLTGSNPQHF